MAATKKLKNISSFLSGLGFPLYKSRWSWGASSNLGVILTTWEDDLDATGRFVRVLGWRVQSRSLPGLNERVDHLRTLWSGGLAGYAVVAKAKDTTANPRKIGSYDSQNVRTIVSLVAQPDGSVWAELGDDVPVNRLKKHAGGHRLIPAEGGFPMSRAATRSAKGSAATYIAKLPAMRQWLIAVARRGGTTTYAEARNTFGLRTLEHRHAMGRIGHECVDAGEPILTSLIVDETTGRCSKGFAKEFRCDDADARKDCYEFWTPLQGKAEDLRKGGSAPSSSGAKPNESLSARAARFARASVRPEQAAFRRRVFLEHGGACVVTGCTIPEALDAAHRNGRDWRLGHNCGADGLLLRKDVHALYDARLISFEGTDNLVCLRPDIDAHYPDYFRKP